MCRRYEANFSHPKGKKIHSRQVVILEKLKSLMSLKSSNICSIVTGNRMKNSVKKDKNQKK